MDIFETWLADAQICKNGYAVNDILENTTDSLKEAIKNNFAICLTVQSLNDDNIICFAEKTLARLTNKSGYVWNYSLDEILKLAKTDNFEILTLEKALKTINGKVPVIINIANICANGKMESAIYKMLSNYKGEYAIMSSNPYAVNWFKENAPTVLRGLKSRFYKDKKVGSFKASKLKKLKYVKFCDPMFICYESKDLPNRYIKKHEDKLIIAYNVKDNESYISVLPHCDNVIFSGFEPEI